MHARLTACGFALAIVAGCTDDGGFPEAEAIMGVPESESWTFAQLQSEVQVVRTEGNVPHIYAHNRNDLGFVLGFVTARDRYFMMDLERRLGKGKISELLGQDALQTDQENRGAGLAFVSAQIEQALEGELAEYVDAFAAGINAYIGEVAKGLVPEPSEIALAAVLLGISDTQELLQPFDRSDVAAMIAVIVYNSSYETDDIGRTATVAALPTLFEGQPFQDLRRNGAREDLYQQIRPIHMVASAPNFAGAQTKKLKIPAIDMSPGMRAATERLAKRMDRRNARLGRDPEVGWGSNAWAVDSASSADGSTLMAGDGHLGLSAPTLLFRFGIDTRVFGRGDIEQLGLTVPGLPLVALGTNGRVAWSQTQIAGDVTDWYQEELRLDDDGVPSHCLFRGEWKPLVKVDERYVIANVEALDSVGRTEVWSRWETFDGRWIAEIEGREALPNQTEGPGEEVVNLQGNYLIPGDRDGDGKVSAISFDYTGFDAGHVTSAFEAFGKANDVTEFMEAAKGLVANSLNYAVADNQGSIMYGAFQPFPCRTHLNRAPDGTWAEGANPQLLIDGTQYGAFSIPFVEGVLDEASTVADACVIPYTETPHVINPEKGYVVTANNDLGGMSFDNDLSNDGRYFGGPWNMAFRANTITTELEKAIEEGTADIAKMSEIQGNIDSPLGALLLSDMLASVAYAAALGATPADAADQRITAIYRADTVGIDEVVSRLGVWRDRGFKARSGVETFYNEPDEQDREDAVATMIFNAWMGRVLGNVFNDEGLPGGVFRNSGTHAQLRALVRFLDGRGSGNPMNLASFNSVTGESIFFDVLSTPEVETSHEVIMMALQDALLFLRSTPEAPEGEEVEPGTGGFATSDMSQWLWGLRHYVEFESLLGAFIDGEEFKAITNQFAITTDNVPMTDKPIPKGDPREGLLWFPRDADQYAVDAGNPGTSGVRFSYGSGPVMRMVVSLKGDEVRGVNIMPGGQSALTDSEYFNDQARLWLANETTPMRFSVAQVIGYSEATRENYRPAAP